MDTLYIIGNGFDLYHKLDTWYSTFGLFLQKNYHETYNLFIEYYGLPELDDDDEESLKDPLWADFENSLAILDAKTLLDNHLEYGPNYASDDFREGDRYNIQIYIQQIVEKITDGLRDAFTKFIENVSYPVISESSLAKINNEAIFLSFNYTNTLERYYNVDRSNILYIHNKAGEQDVLILGHGIDPKEFEEKEETAPTDLEEYEMWRDHKADMYDYSIELGKDEIRQYFLKSFKPTNLILERHYSFFKKLDNIKKIFVLGHSLSEVDMPYFCEIMKNIDEDVKWIISYYREEERESKRMRIIDLGVECDKIIMIKIENL